MLIPTNPASAIVTNMAAQACIELLAAYGVKLTPSPSGWSPSHEDAAVFGIMGFGGSGVRATCLLGAEQRLVEASCRSSNRPRDWIAELANQLVGRVKMKLLSYGVSVTMTTPLALSGVHVTPLPRLGQDPLAFTSDLGAALIWLELETDAQFSLKSERPLGIEPGDSLF